MHHFCKIKIIQPLSKAKSFVFQNSKIFMKISKIKETHETLVQQYCYPCNSTYQNRFIEECSEKIKSALHRK